MHLIRLSRGLAAAVFFASALAVGPAAAQAHLVFAGIPYGTPADSLRGMMEGRGFRHVRTFESGDMRFRAENDAVAMAMVGPRGLRGVMVWMPAADPAARRVAMADSLRRAIGAPVDTTDGRLTWNRGRSVLTLQTGSEQEGGAEGVILFYAGPSMLDESSRQRDPAADSALAPLEPQWTVLAYAGHGARLSLDTATITRRPGGSYRARIRIDEPQVVPDPSGRYDAIVYGADYDCAGQRVQLRSRTALLRGRTVRTDQGATVWVTPRPNSQEALSLGLLCEYVDKNAVPRTSP